jgi:hypothetical protein
MVTLIAPGSMQTLGRPGFDACLDELETPLLSLVAKMSTTNDGKSVADPEAVPKHPAEVGWEQAAEVFVIQLISLSSAIIQNTSHLIEQILAITCQRTAHRQLIDGYPCLADEADLGT